MTVENYPVLLISLIIEYEVAKVELAYDSILLRCNDALESGEELVNYNSAWSESLP